MGIECPSGAPAITTRRVDGFVVPLDSEKRFCHNVVAFPSTHDDSLVGQSVGGNRLGMLACVTAALQLACVLLATLEVTAWGCSPA